MDFMTDIAPKITLDEEMREIYGQCIESVIDQVMFQAESRCPEYRKAMRKKRALEDELFLGREELRSVYFKQQTQMDYTLLKSVFYLGVKTGIEIAR